MSYDLHIMRRKFWSDSGRDITIEEWHAAIDADPELILRPEMGPHVAMWNSPGTQGEPCLDWSFGDVVARSPERPFIDKMVALAQNLEARVQGDFGEFYALTDGPIPPMPTLRVRIISWLANLRGK